MAVLATTAAEAQLDVYKRQIRRNSKQPTAVKMEPARDETPKTPVKYSADLLLELAESFGVSVEELVSSDFRDKVLSMDENADRVEELEEELEEAAVSYTHLYARITTERPPT